MGPFAGWYARRRDVRARQIVADVFVACWAVLWAVIGVATTRTLSAVADPLRRASSQTGQLADQTRQVAEQSSRIPAVGGDLRVPIDGISNSLANVLAAIDEQIALIDHAATLLGWLVFVIPTLTLVLVWLATRLRFRRRARAAYQLLRSDAGIDLFALRALTTQPLHVIAELSDDPLTEWRAQNPHIVVALAAAELRACGLEPSPRR